MHSRGLVDYLKKRFLRIYPAFIAALLVCICIVGPLSRGSIGSYFHEKDTYLFLRPLFLRNISDHLPGVFTTVPFAGPVNGSLWTIRYEIVCYLIIAALGIAALLKKRAVIAVLFLAVMGVYFARSRGIAIPHVEEATLMPRLLTYYLAGTVFYLYRDKIPYSPGVFALVVAGIVVSFVLNISLYTYPLLGTYLLFFIAFCPALRMENFARYGDFSYGTYLYAFPVQQLLIQYMGKSLNPYTLFLLAWLITVPLAAASWYLVEKPFLRLKPRRRPVTEPEAVVRTPILYEKPAAAAVEPDK
jgi:peptidoglycan/LPS O-acetylase OafA/YrhL